MFNLKHWLNLAANPQDYLWIEAILIKETKKAILIEFDGRKIWLPKAWILRIKRNNLRHYEPRRGEAISIKIKISQYHWAKSAQ